MQRTSRNQTFIPANLVGIQAVLSMHAGSKNAARFKGYIRCGFANVRFQKGDKRCGLPVMSYYEQPFRVTGITDVAASVSSVVSK